MAETTRLNDVNLEDCRLVFKNLSGNEGKFNAAGNRNFCVLLSPEEGKALREEGWNVKELKPREEGDLPQAYLKVKVNYKSGRPPQIYLVTAHGKTLLDESNVNLIDWADIKMVDLIISPYRYEVRGNQGIAAYCSKMWVTINEDPFTAKYEDNGDDVPDDALNTTIFPQVD